MHRRLRPGRQRGQIIAEGIVLDGFQPLLHLGAIADTLPHEVYRGHGRQSDGKGQDLRGLTQGSLRARLGLVPQDVALFNDTLRMNIAYARPDARPEEVALAARRARAHDFIMRLPKGYETLVGERGPEIIVPQRAATVINSADSRGFGASPPVVVNLSNHFDVGLEAVEDRIAALTPRISQAVTDAVIKARQRPRFA